MAFVRGRSPARNQSVGPACVEVKNTFINLTCETQMASQRSASAPPASRQTPRASMGAVPMMPLQGLEAEAPRLPTENGNARPLPMDPKTHNMLVADLEYWNRRYRSAPAWGFTQNPVGTRMKWANWRPASEAEIAKFRLTHMSTSEEEATRRSTGISQRGASGGVPSDIGKIDEILLEFGCAGTDYTPTAVMGPTRRRRAVQPPADKGEETNEGYFKDVCLVDALRAHRYKVPYVADGPCWAQKHGNQMLAPFGKSIQKVSGGISAVDDTSKYVIFDPAKRTDLGTVAHFQALKKVDGELLLADTNKASSFKPFTEEEKSSTWRWKIYQIVDANAEERDQASETTAAPPPPGTAARGEEEAARVLQETAAQAEAKLQREKDPVAASETTAAPPPPGTAAREEEEASRVLRVHEHHFDIAFQAWVASGRAASSAAAPPPPAGHRGAAFLGTGREAGAGDTESEEDSIGGAGRRPTVEQEVGTDVKREQPDIFPTLLQRRAAPMNLLEMARGPPMTNVGLSMVQARFRQGCIEATRFSRLSCPGAAQCSWSDFAMIEDAQLPEGSYAAVKCLDEDFFRLLNTEPAMFGEAGGHSALAAERPVVFAGELCLGVGMQLSAWNNVSGTYQIPFEASWQSNLPQEIGWKFLDKDEVASRPGTQQLRFLRGPLGKDATGASRGARLAPMGPMCSDAGSQSALRNWFRCEKPHVKVGNDHLVTRLAAIMMGPRYRAHPDGVYHYRNGTQVAPWALDLCRAVGSITGRFTSKASAKDLVDSFGSWLKTPRPTTTGRSPVTFDDAAVVFDARPGVPQNERVQQIPKGMDNNCYFGIPGDLGCVIPDHIVDRLRLIMCTSYAGADAGREADLAMECLAFMGVAMPPVLIWYTGTGGNSKSARTILRNNVFGDHATTISSEAFQVKEEFRKQGGQVAFAKVLTVQECAPGVSLIEHILKCWISGERIARRALFGRVTEYFRWDKCAKFWETNMACPSLAGDPERLDLLRAWLRRIICVELTATFSADRAKVSVDDRVFPEDADLSEFLSSPEVRFAYITMYIIPLIKSKTVDELRQILMMPNEELRAATRRLAAQMANGGLDAPPGLMSERAENLAIEAAKKVVISAHEDAWQRRFVKKYEVNKYMKNVPGEELYEATADIPDFRGLARAADHDDQPAGTLKEWINLIQLEGDVASGTIAGDLDRINSVLARFRQGERDGDMAGIDGKGLRQDIADEFETHMEFCVCGCRLCKKGDTTHEAIVHDLHTATTTVTVTPWQCNSKKCRLTYGPNFVWVGGRKKNTATLADLECAGVLFISSKRGFTMRYVRYYEAMLFRNFVSARGADWVQKDVFDDGDGSGWQGKEFPFDMRKLHGHAIMYALAVQELEPLDKHLDIYVEEDISESALRTYDDHLHQRVYPPANSACVTELVGDGHEKVLVRCNGGCGLPGGKVLKRPSAARKFAGKALMKKPATAKARSKPKPVAKRAAVIKKPAVTKAGTKRKTPRSLHHNNGWFMLLTTSGRVVAVTEQTAPEGNDVVKSTILRVLPQYPKVNCIVYDRACSVMPSALLDDQFNQIKYWVVDRLHAQKHVPTCACNPLHIHRLKLRIIGLNTQVAEQCFSATRGSSTRCRPAATASWSCTSLPSTTQCCLLATLTTWGTRRQPPVRFTRNPVGIIRALKATVFLGIGRAGMRAAICKGLSRFWRARMHSVIISRKINASDGSKLRFTPVYVYV
ncbi:unnamed protein product [Prorocentrum cordatum]|uniref:Uncharacterized protein n=1 Tax=Prorocentrum cordatum TaxID=2364126 RepID=A0ABN9RAL4_9DINO|nr:unnamed protein product [Polarella glacialis]